MMVAITGQDLRKGAELSSPGVLCAPGAAGPFRTKRGCGRGKASLLGCLSPMVGACGHHLCFQSLSHWGCDKNPEVDRSISYALEVVSVASLVAGPAAVVVTSEWLSHKEHAGTLSTSALDVPS